MHIRGKGNNWTNNSGWDNGNGWFTKLLNFTGISVFRTRLCCDKIWILYFYGVVYYPGVVQIGELCYKRILI